MSIFVEVMKEELDRNLRKQAIFEKELNSLDKSYLSICKIDGKEYLYKKRRDKSRIISIYVGPIGSDEAISAKAEREEYLEIKCSLKNLKKEEKSLRKAISVIEKSNQ